MTALVAGEDQGSSSSSSSTSSSSSSSTPTARVGHAAAVLDSSDGDLKGWWIEGLSIDPAALSRPEYKLLDRVLGCIYGNALGDAVGLGKQQI
jgi:hypothetical protein